VGEEAGIATPKGWFVHEVGFDDEAAHRGPGFIWIHPQTPALRTDKRPPSVIAQEATKQTVEQRASDTLVTAEARGAAAVLAKRTGASSLELFFDIVYAVNFSMTAQTLSQDTLEWFATLKYALVLLSVINAWVESMLFTSIAQTNTLQQESYFIASFISMQILVGMTAYDNWPVAKVPHLAAQAFCFWYRFWLPLLYFVMWLTLPTLPSRCCLFELVMAARYYHQLDNIRPPVHQMAQMFDKVHLAAYLKVSRVGSRIL
jgi:hypothetical protein